MRKILFITTGCPASIGPEVSVVAASKVRGIPRVLIGDPDCLERAAQLREHSGNLQTLPRDFASFASLRPGTYILASGPRITAADRRPGRPSATSGLAQLDYVETGANWCARLTRDGVPAALITAAVSKSAIARSGRADAARFRGHTEWLQELDGSDAVTMCFAGKRLNTALVTTHLPIAEVPRALTVAGVARSCVHLAELLRRRGHKKPRVCLTALNPHAGEDELLGHEEGAVLRPGLEAAQHTARYARFVGPIGAETAIRHAHAGRYDGVVSIYHDQATIPMKLVEFGTAVNVTMGLSYLRTSVDHGTAYDIAWKGIADPSAMVSALRLAKELAP